MKKFTLLLSLCLAICFYTGANVKKGPLKPINKVETFSSIQKTNSKIKPIPEQSSQKVEETKSSAICAKVSARNANSQLKARLDSLVYKHSDGTNYTKQVYEYNEDYFDTSEKQYMWIGEEWVIVKAFSFEWEKKSFSVFLTAVEEIEYFLDDDGQPLYDENDQRFHMGQRYEYTYDQNGFLASQTNIFIENGNKMPEIKKTFINDLRGNPTELYQFFYDGLDWSPELKALVVYDNLNREKEVENYWWDGTEWQGDSKGKYEYDPISGHNTLFEYPVWDTALRIWVNDQKKIQIFENGRLVELGEYFWNEERQDWVGAMKYGEWAYCSKAVLTYNAEGLQTSETNYVLPQNGDWTETVYMDITYTPIAGEDGMYQYERKTYFTVDSVKEQWQTLIYKYYIANNAFTPVIDHKPLPTNSVVVYAYEMNYKTKEGYEDYYIYDSALNLSESKEYIYETTTGTKYASMWSFLEYDTNKNVTKLTSMTGQHTGTDDWQYVTMFEYQYGNDNIKTRDYMYQYDDGNWIKAYGNGIDMDYSVLANQLVVNLSYDNPYKVTYQYAYENEGGNVWSTSKRTYHYSSLDGSSIKNTENKLFSVSPNPVIDMITINTTEENIQVNLYNMQGANLLQTNEKQINLSGFTPGMYILEVNGAKAKIMKK